MQRMFRAAKSSRGFTFVEVLVIVPPILLVTAMIISGLFSLVLDNSQSEFKVTSATNVKSALNTIEQDMKTGAALLTTTDSQMVDAYVSDSGGTSWNFAGTSSTQRVLIIRGYATTADPVSIVKDPVYVNQFGCSGAELFSNPVLTTNIIYFVKNGSLYRRVLTDNTKTTCQTPFQRQSCPPDIASPPASCKASDSLLLTDVTNFNVNYYTGGTLISNPYGSSDPQVLSQATTAEPTITVARQVSDSLVSSSDSLRVNKNNSQPYNAPPPTSASGAPAIVTGLTANRQVNSVRLNWTAVAGATSYQIERSLTPYFTTTTTVYTGTSQTFNDTNVVYWTQYYYRIRAMQGNLAGVWSSYVAGSMLGPSVLSPGASLTVGQYMNSPSGLYTAIMQGDGNFVLYNAQNQPLWGSGTNYGASYNMWLLVQYDGNVVIYDNGNVPYWSTVSNMYGASRCYRFALSNAGVLTLRSYTSDCETFIANLWQAP